MFSMTGYGKGTATENGITLTIEIKSVNNRFLEINSRLPKSLTAFEDILRKEIQNLVKRGSVDVFFNLEHEATSSKLIAIDEGLAKGYANAANVLSKMLNVPNDLTATQLIRMPDVIKVEAVKNDAEILERLFKQSIREALKELNAMRFKEGESIKLNLSDLINNISECLKLIEVNAESVIGVYRQKLEARIKELLNSVEIDEARLVNEVAYFADKSDINEEISRLGSHIDQFNQTILSDEQQGRKLDFISQEINREINTIGSKSGDTAITAYVLKMKNELEKIKEQIRNVE